MGRQGGQGKGKPKMFARDLGKALVNQLSHQKQEARRRNKPLLSVLDNTSQLEDFVSIANDEGKSPDVLHITKETFQELVQEDKEIATLVRLENKNIQSMNFNEFQFEQLSIPRKPAWTKEMTAEQVSRNEMEAFMAWRREISDLEEKSHQMKVTPFEKNIEVWKQLWRVMERCDFAIQILDARNPLLFYTTDLERYAHEQSPPKHVLLLVNKADFLSEYHRKCWAAYFISKNFSFVFYSAKNSQDLIDLETEREKEQERIRLQILKEENKKQLMNRESDDDDEDGEIEHKKSSSSSSSSSTSLPLKKKVNIKDSIEDVDYEFYLSQFDGKHVTRNGSTGLGQPKSTSSTSSSSSISIPSLENLNLKDSSPSSSSSTTTTNSIVWGDFPTNKENKREKKSEEEEEGEEEEEEDDQENEEKDGEEDDLSEDDSQNEEEDDDCNDDEDDDCSVDSDTPAYSHSGNNNGGDAGDDDDDDDEPTHDQTLEGEYSNLIHSSQVRECARVLSRIQLIHLLELISLKLSLSPSKKNNQNRICIGLLGYPNVGKSSVINTLLNISKSSHGVTRVGVSSTPGKTKHFQTLILNDSLLLCDCPGLVFPSFMRNTGEMLCSGVLPINQMRDSVEPANLIASRVPYHLLEATYGLKIRKALDLLDDPSRPPTGSELCIAYCAVKGYITSSTGRWDEFRACKELLRDFNDGRLLCVCPPPPPFKVDIEFWLSEVERVCVKNERVSDRIALQRLKEADEINAQETEGLGGDGGSIAMSSRRGGGGGTVLSSPSFVYSRTVFDYTPANPQDRLRGGDGIGDGEGLAIVDQDGFVYVDSSDDDDDDDNNEGGEGLEVENASQFSAASKSTLGVNGKEKREHKRLKHWGKKNRKLRNKTPYGDSEDFQVPQTLHAYSTNRQGAFSYHSSSSISSTSSSTLLSNISRSVSGNTTTTGLNPSKAIQRGGGQGGGGMMIGGGVGLTGTVERGKGHRHDPRHAYGKPVVRAAYPHHPTLKESFPTDDGTEKE